MDYDSRKKILFLDHTPFVGGAQLSLIQHLANIDYSKFEVMLACSENVNQQLEEEYRKLDIKYIKISFGRLKTFGLAAVINLCKSVILLIRLIKKNQIDVLASITVRACIAGSLAAWFARRPSIWLIRDFTFNRIFFSGLSLLPKKIIYNSKAVAAYYRPNFIPDKKHSIVYVGRDFYKKVEKISAEQISAQRSRWGATRDTIIVGYVGRLVGWKGIQVLISAVGNLIRDKNYLNLKLIIAGTGSGQQGDSESMLRGMVIDKKLENHIIFLGQQKELASIIKSMEILVLPSLEPEPFSSVVVDAMMAKIAVIGTNIGGTPEIIIDGHSGLLVEPNSPQALSTAIEQLMFNFDLRSKIIEAAYSNVMKNYTAKKITGKLEQIYLSALE